MNRKIIEVRHVRDARRDESKEVDINQWRVDPRVSPFSVSKANLIFFIDKKVSLHCGFIIGNYPVNQHEPVLIYHVTGSAEQVYLEVGGDKKTQSKSTFYLLGQIHNVELLRFACGPYSLFNNDCRVISMKMILNWMDMGNISQDSAYICAQLCDELVSSDERSRSSIPGMLSRIRNKRLHR